MPPALQKCSFRAATGALIHDARARDLLRAKAVMGKVIFDISMSLDGFITADHRTAAEPLGRDGERLHEWAFNDDPRNRELLQNAIASLGASIAGRKTYDDSIPFWGADGPTGRARRPLFVVTHEAPRDSPANGVYTFVTDGIESALAQAKRVAGDKDVAIMGGANLGQQYIAAGLVDEIQIHHTPLLFGDGLRMFEHIGTDHRQLEIVEVVATPAATHVRYRLPK